MCDFSGSTQLERYLNMKSEALKLILSLGFVFVFVGCRSESEPKSSELNAVAQPVSVEQKISDIEKHLRNAEQYFAEANAAQPETASFIQRRGCSSLASAALSVGTAKLAAARAGTTNLYLDKLDGFKAKVEQRRIEESCN